MTIWPNRNPCGPQHHLPGGREAAAALDLWIARDLRRAYDPVLSEPLPENLLLALADFG